MDLEITFPYKSDLTIPVLSEKLKSTPADSTVTITNVPKSEEGKLKLNMTLSGFLKVQVNDGSVTAQTPKYKLGTAQSISDRNTIDASNLLTDKDKEKPTAESLKAACGTGKKRRACAGCTCGLAEELNSTDVEKADAVRAEAVASGSAPKSACGSCYLGDAFRCASCPYLGMPAFKPGPENKPDLKKAIVLDDDTMDI